MKISGMYLITDRIEEKELFEKVKLAVKSGVNIVQLRDKKSSTVDFIKKALVIKKICEGKCLFIINDRVDISLAVKSDGVHLGQDDMPLLFARKILKEKIIGVSVDNLYEAKKAEKDGADYISIGPIFPTRTKLDVPAPCGLDVIREIKKSVKIPLVAVGGINAKNIREVYLAGSDAFAISSYIMQSSNVQKKVKLLKKKVLSGKKLHKPL